MKIQVEDSDNQHNVVHDGEDVYWMQMIDDDSDYEPIIPMEDDFSDDQEYDFTDIEAEIEYCSRQYRLQNSVVVEKI